MTMMSPQRWRDTHPRCSFCKWLKFEVVKVNLPMADYYKCIVKDKIITCTSLPRPWCRCYQTKYEEFMKESDI